MTALRILLAGLGAFCGCLLIAPILIGGLIFSVVSLFTRFIVRCVEPKPTPWSQFIEFDPTFGWKPKAMVTAYHAADGVFYSTTDAHGWRGKTSLLDSQIVVFGDSFAWGFGAHDKHFFADLNPDLRIKAIGTCGYNMVQELLWMQHLSSHLTGKLVVWFIYFGNDLYENLAPSMGGYRMPFVREIDGTDNWEIVSSHISPAQWFPAAGLPHRDYYRWLAELCGPTHLSTRAYAACEFLIQQGKALCDQAGAQLVVMTIPDITQLTSEGLQTLISRGNIDANIFDPDFPDQNLREICQRLSIPHVATKHYLNRQNHHIHDCHWNPRGHRRIAELLAQLHFEYHGVTEAHQDIKA